MPRAVTALLGPTNTGKTHLAIERMLTHASGMIGFPLRLLARENYDRVSALKGPEAVALVTGEERVVPRRPCYWIATVEAMPLDLKVDFLAVDEVQLAADRERGHVFTDRILGARGALETWLIGAETIRPLLHELLPGAAFQTRERLSTLSYAEPKRLSKLQPRSAVVVFSLHELYEVASRLRRERGGAALVFGALSPRTRNAQVALYQAGEVDHLVATDAIGMGLNLDIDTVVFTGLTKFDGVGPRPLTPAEVGQIAGRAGRHVQDGHFAASEELGPLDRRLVEAVESHRFAPLTRLFWRTDQLDFFSPLALLGSLERQPPHPFLVRMRHAEDARALAALVRDPETMALARDPESVRLLWEVCQVPDFQSVLTDAHTRLLAHVFRFLRGPGGRIPEDFLQAHVRDLDRTEGEVDALLGRIAAIRTWTYLSNRSTWVPDPRYWQERTRAVEDRLSDALHERLTQEFVDRPGTVIARYDASELVTTIAGDGEVLVQGLRAGVMEGFRFRPDHGKGDGSRGLLAAANRALRSLVRERVQALEADPDQAFALGPGAELLWHGSAVARLLAGESALTPQVDVLPSDLLEPPLRERVRRRLAAWLEGMLQASLGPLFRLRERAPAGAARGLAFVLAEGLGAAARRSVAAQVAGLSGEDRRDLSRLGVSVGRFAVFLPTLQRPESMRLRARLFAVRHGLRGWTGPDGAPSVSNDLARPLASYLASGYLPLGPRAVRLDRLEQAAALLARLSRSGPFPAPRELPRIVGCSPAELAAVVSAMGYAERDGRFERRARPQRRIARRT
ncbi:MAG TPA: helicase-related protein [Vicinamibacteria bacterium]|nr:helicase-related protein [Vicinamibacteria bacterium]